MGPTSSSSRRRCSRPCKRSTGRSTRAFTDYQTVSERRRQLAADTGELIARFIDALVAAGWSEEEARNANVDELSRSTEEQQP